jgi:superfamily II DNA helicase RecQ
MDTKLQKILQQQFKLESFRDRQEDIIKSVID